MPTLFIIDGYSILYKGYYAIRGLSTREGIPTNAIFGFANMLFKTLRETEAKYVCVTLDSKGPTFRNQIYEDYKSNRPEMPEDLQVQIPYLNRLLDALKITRLERQGYEADDLIATLSSMAVERGWETKILTADKDLFQIVTDKAHILRFEKNDLIEYDPQNVEKKMGVRPEKIADLFGLMGDSSDNIPGVPGIGPKTAVKLLKKFDSVEEIIENSKRIENKRIQNKINDYSTQALISKKLATVKHDVLIEVDFDDLHFSTEVSPELESLLLELEFKKLISTLREQENVKKSENRETNYRIIRQIEELQDYINEAMKSELVALDTETTSLDCMQCKLVGISMSYRPNEAVYIPVGHSEAVAGGPQIPIDKVKRIISPLLESEKVKKCGHNLKYDIKVLHNADFKISNISFDSMLASRLLDPGTVGHGLKFLSSALLGIRMNPIQDLIGKGKQEITMAEVPVKDAAPYACLDADATLQLCGHLAPRLKEHEMNDLYYNLELPLLEVLSKMEETGIAIDQEHFFRLKKQNGEKLIKIIKECHNLAGSEFNLNSPQQIGEILFQKIRLTPLKKGKSGYSTDVNVLTALSKEHPLPGKILEYRSIEKLMTTYIETLPEQVNPATGRIHTTFMQIGAATGRLASKDPNLQNIPVRTEAGKAIRRGFIPGETGWMFLAADYSQIELRILAHLSGDPMMSDAFHRNKDIHAATAAKIFGILEEFVTPEMRNAAKIINFGIIYGMSAHRLSRELDISHSEASRFIKDYFTHYSQVKDWMDNLVKKAKKNGYVETLLGRRRYVPDLKSPNYNIRSGARRIAINSPIQGTSADMIKLAMLKIDRELKGKNYQARMLIQVHDELIFEAPEEELPRLEKIVKTEMENALPLDVPVQVGIKTGSNWSEC